MDPTPTITSSNDSFSTVPIDGLDSQGEFVKIVVAAISTVGISTNIVIFIMLAKSYSKTKTSSMFLLVVLTLSDWLFVAMQLSAWFIYTQDNEWWHYDPVVQWTFVLILNTSFTMTSWSVVLIAFDRYVLSRIYVSTTVK